MLSGILILFLFQNPLNAAPNQERRFFSGIKRESGENKEIVHYNKGIAYSNAKKYEEAIKEYDKAISINPEFYQAHVNKGNILEKLGRYDEAIETIKKGLNYNPSDEIGWGSLANVYFSLKDYNASIKAAEKCISIKPQKACFITKGHSYERTGQFRTSHEVYDSALKFFPKDKDLLFNRMLQAFKMNNVQCAEKDMLFFKKHFPKDDRLPLFEGGLKELQKMEKDKK